MFVHIGGYTVIRSKDIVAILNYDVHESSTVTQQYLASLNENEIVKIAPDGDSTKSLVVTSEKLYHSPISSTTLKRRSQNMLDDGNDEP
ncbi:DUF370 domain-containing protein [Salicibibacter halophilus]|uniref:DUF370 domain-containing protein n=1 Tax=Salicibibacter halophilus TaxID=2502791 RepID=A0A514LJD7_9BACI|nr:extracellular matrix/biofilm biosynthesis regulator RemA family protein [Salicibibacter halophilus]QDI91635.1 DUF370 domain-containing protein [Salicibibacter halophilus]